MKVMVLLKNVNEELILSPKIIICRRNIFCPVIYRKLYSSFGRNVLCGGHFKKKPNINGQSSVLKKNYVLTYSENSTSGS